MELLKPIIDSDKTEALLGSYLQSCLEQSTFVTQDASEEKSLITAINSKLNEPSTRFVGLSLLHTFLQNCSQSTVNENAISWISMCLKGTVSPVASTCSLSYQVLSCLFCCCSDQAKHIGSAVLPKLFEHLQFVPQYCLPAALSCLESCMKVYNGPCGPHKNCIEKLLISVLDFNGPNKAAVVWKNAVCLALVPQLGGSGTGGVTHQINWTKQLKAACSTLHQILDLLLNNISELEVHNIVETRGDTFALKAVEDNDPIATAYFLASRFEAVVNCVEAMLLGECGVVKHVPPNAVLSVICRGLGVSSMSLKNISTTESLVLSTILPTLQTKLFDLLDALVDCCGANLLPFGRLVVKLVLQTLKWTSVKDWKHKSAKPYQPLRSAAYRCIRHWLDTIRAVPNCDELAELVEMACSDFRVQADGVRLLSGKRKSKYGERNDAKRKRASHSAAAAAAGSSSGDPESALDASANKDVCIAALQAVQALVAVHGWALHGGSYSMLHESTVSLVLSVSCQASNPVIPYGEAAVRLELYRLLSSLVSHPHPNVSPPIRMSWTLFSLGQNDPNLQVSSFCFQALHNLEKIVHPSFVPLALPIPETEEEKNANESLLASQTIKLPAGKVVDLVTSSEISKETPPETGNAEKPSERNLSNERSVGNGIPKTNRDQEMINVPDSDDDTSSNGVDIEQIPVEIDLAGSEAGSEAGRGDGSTESGDQIEVIEVTETTVLKSGSGSVDDFRLCISPDPASTAIADEETTRTIKRPFEPVSGSTNGDKGGGEPPIKVVAVEAEADFEPDVNSMLASFVDKVKSKFQT